MKKTVSWLVTLALFMALGTGGLWAGAQGQSGQTLTAIVLGNTTADALREIGANYAKTHSGFVLEMTAIDGVTDFNTALAAKIAARDIPDIIYMQWDTGVTRFAQNGYLLPLDDLGLDSKIVAIKKKINVVNGKTYAYPGVQSLWGTFWNENLARKYGVTTVPKSLPQLVDAFEIMRQNGLRYPFVTPGMDLSGAVAWVFAYMHQQISGIDPLFYLKLCTGEKSFAGPEIREMYEWYGKLLAYAPPDVVGLDPEQFRQRYAREEYVAAVQGTGMITQLRTLNPNFDFVLAPAIAVINEQNYGVISDFDTAIGIGATTKNVALAKDFYKYIYSPENSAILATTLAGISPVKDATPKYDSAVNVNIPYIQRGNFVGFSERDWIPGIKDVLKKNTQDWMSGALPLDQVLNNLQNEHQRLIAATPAYVDEYRELLRSIGLLK
jgi:ABC-type glycerol-3-phosphate transport system substrate-binding protein